MVVRGVAGEEVSSETACAGDGIERVLVDVAAGVSDAVHDADERRAGIAGELLNLTDDAGRYLRKGLFGAQYEADALAEHSAGHLGGARVGCGIVAKRAIEKRLELGRCAIPIDGRCGDEAVCGKVAFEEDGAEAVIDCAFSIWLAAFAAVSQEEADEVVDVCEFDLVAGLFEALADRLSQDR